MQTPVESWINEITALWELDILDTQPGIPGDLQDITEIFQAIGWQWYIDKYGKDGLYKEHHNGRTMKWCGAGLAAAGVSMGRLGINTTGLQLNPRLAEIVLPSTYRLNNPQAWFDAGVTQTMPLKHIKNMRRGDIVVTGKQKKYGDHITMCTRTSLLSFETIECNAFGRTFSKGRKEGIVRNTRKYAEAARVYRPDWTWFIEQER